MKFSLRLVYFKEEFTDLFASYLFPFVPLSKLDHTKWICGSQVTLVACPLSLASVFRNSYLASFALVMRNNNIAPVL